LLSDQLQQTLGVDRGAGEGNLGGGRQIGAGHTSSFRLFEHRLRLIVVGLGALCCAETMHFARKNSSASAA
jgi:hypothetical protein